MSSFSVPLMWLLLLTAATLLAIHFSLEREKGAAWKAPDSEDNRAIAFGLERKLRGVASAAFLISIALNLTHFLWARANHGLSLYWGLAGGLLSLLSLFLYFGSDDFRPPYVRAPRASAKLRVPLVLLLAGTIGTCAVTSKQRTSALREQVAAWQPEVTALCARFPAYVEPSARHGRGPFRDLVVIVTEGDFDGFGYPREVSKDCMLDPLQFELERAAKSSDAAEHVALVRYSRHVEGKYTNGAAASYWTGDVRVFSSSTAQLVASYRIEGSAPTRKGNEQPREMQFGYVKDGVRDFLAGAN